VFVARKGPCCFCRLQIENLRYRRRRPPKKMTEFPFPVLCNGNKVASSGSFFFSVLAQSKSRAQVSIKAPAARKWV
jgi:hypothetical protein